MRISEISGNAPMSKGIAATAQTTDGGQSQRQSELGAHQAAHQRVADLGLLLHLDPGP